MEVENGAKNILNVIVVEFFGVLVFTLAYNLDDGSHMPAATWFILFTMIWRVSGGHCNPAISLGVWIEQKQYGLTTHKNACILVCLWLAQFAGALAALAVGLMLRTTLP